MNPRDFESEGEWIDAIERDNGRPLDYDEWYRAITQWSSAIYDQMRQEINT